MRLLLYQNLLYRLVDSLGDIFSGISHVKFENLKDKNDLEIWQFAKSHNYSIVTFDADFHDLQVLKGLPPKIIWLQFGNKPRKELEDFLSGHQEIIRDFLQQPDKACLEFR